MIARFAPAALAALALASAPAPAHAREQIDPAAMSAAIRYALPHLLTAVRSTCAARLAPDGYLATNGDALHARFTQGADAAWPQAKLVIAQFGAKEDGGAMQMMQSLPDESLKPFVDGMITMKVAGEIKPAQCSDIERGLELMAPLPPENIAALTGFILEMVSKRSDTKQKAAPEAARAATGD
ncbi:hypothetical protein [Qipengyuania marisflavi]|uniref:Uncharacterized protein n=1 Tax=Qipengyuania marisflavi TaxID=2486356 RepID=A0A5S3P8W0_9SPHN|nr:hypothetical protein [Qipengyuania marisflavi]TMM49934.1 hypothetical protein FEV51_01680 [Qipengyuania marisflavi]